MIQPDHPEIQRWIARVGVAPEALFYAVRDELRYDLAPRLEARGDWAASATIERRSGFCQQKAVVLASLLRGVGVPAAIDFQHLRDHKLLDPRFEKTLPGGIIAFHGRVQAHLGGRWRILDPTLDRRLCEARGYRLTEPFEALPATDLAGASHFDELGRAGPFADLPRVVSEVALSLGGLWAELTRARERGASM